MNCVMFVFRFLMKNMLAMHLMFIISFLIVLMKVRFIMKFATRYIPPKSPSVRFEKPSMTDRSFKSECDINEIVQRCMRTGWPPDDGKAIYGDFGDIPDNLLEVYDKIQDAETRFMTLPSDLRAEFNNNPLALLQALQDPSKDELMVQYGLKEKAPSAASQSVSDNVLPKETNVVNPPSDGGES